MKLSVKAGWVLLGFLCFGLGSAGVVLPCLPTVPFYMGTAFCFAKGSQRMHAWFIHTKLYKRHLQSFQERREMDRKTKFVIMTSVSLMMAFGFVMMKDVPVGRVVLGAVWLFHVYYFFFRIKTAGKRTGENTGKGITIYD